MLEAKTYHLNQKLKNKQMLANILGMVPRSKNHSIWFSPTTNWWWQLQLLQWRMTMVWMRYDGQRWWEQLHKGLINDEQKKIRQSFKLKRNIDGDGERSKIILKQMCHQNATMGRGCVGVDFKGEVEMLLLQAAKNGKKEREKEKGGMGGR